jgi:hypothetical protein
MEDMHNGPLGPQLYLLSEEGYEELKSIQTMLSLMAKIAYCEDDDTNGNAMLTIGRAEVHYVLNEISAQIGDALERLGHENWIGTQSYVRQ